MTRSHARKMRELLRSVFGLEALRPGQRAVIDSVLAGRHTLAVMPTGAGKSLCYQLPALLLPGMTVVVSPLIALMRDQHDKLIALGVASAQVNSAVPADLAREAHAQIGDEGTEFFFTTPEQLARPELREKLTKANVDLFVIDEAHCLSQWGHDFRPDYLGLADVVRALGSPTVLALTATAPPAVAVDIVRQLALPDMAFLTTGAWRENLELAVRQVSGDVDKQRALVEVLRQQTGSGIVYAATIAHVREIVDLLRAEGLSATHYHGRLARAGAPRQPGRVHARRDPDHGRHQRVRHGHRQGRHPLRRALRSAGVARRLLPGGGPRRPRRGRRPRACSCSSAPIAGCRPSSWPAAIRPRPISTRC